METITLHPTESQSRAKPIDEFDIAWHPALRDAQSQYHALHITMTAQGTVPIRPSAQSIMTNPTGTGNSTGINQSRNTNQPTNQEAVILHSASLAVPIPL